MIRHLLPITATSISAHSARMYAAQYHGLLEPFSLVAATALLQALLAWGVICFAQAVTKREKVSDFIAIAACLYFMVKTFHGALPAAQLGYNIKILAASGIFICALLLVTGSGKYLRSRFLVAVTIVGAIWSIAPLARSVTQNLGSTESYKVFHYPESQNGRVKASVILILDELSPQSTAPIIDVLDYLQLPVFTGEAKKAGQNTINAIPSLLTGMDYSDVIPCSRTALCGSNFLNFANLSVDNSDVDIIGFWHPYCAITGLRSCKRVEFFDVVENFNFKYFMFNFSTSLPLFGELIPHLPAIKEFNNKVDQVIYENTRKEIRIATMKAYFWQHGGVLYVHYLGPHPTWADTEINLKDHYNENLTDAAEFVNIIVRKLVNEFGSNFTFTITSDHPLRAMWCEQKFYHSPLCRESVPREGDRVPILIGSTSRLQGNPAK